MQPGVADAGALGSLMSACCLAYMVPIVLSITMMVLWIVALIDVLQRADWEFPNHQPGSNDKIVWVLVVMLLNGMGALVYYFMVMKPYPRQRR
jgi:RsiW-degrading membrane proteinase PrsW (M82 family)